MLKSTRSNHECRCYIVVENTLEFRLSQVLVRLSKAIDRPSIEYRHIKMN